MYIIKHYKGYIKESEMTVSDLREKYSFYTDKYGYINYNTGFVIVNNEVYTITITFESSYIEKEIFDKINTLKETNNGLLFEVMFNSDKITLERFLDITYKIHYEI